MRNNLVSEKALEVQRYCVRKFRIVSLRRSSYKLQNIWLPVSLDPAEVFRRRALVSNVLKITITVRHLDAFWDHAYIYLSGPTSSTVVYNAI